MLFKHPARAVLLTIASLAAIADADEAVPLDSPYHANLMGPSHFLQTDGAQLYQAVCQACHMANAMGGAGAAAFPALAKNAKLAEAGYPISMVTNGHKAMPGFKSQMSDAQIAAVVTYVRTHFGNDYKDPVALEQVAATRAAGP